MGRDALLIAVFPEQKSLKPAPVPLTTKGVNNAFPAAPVLRYSLIASSVMGATVLEPLLLIEPIWALEDRGASNKPIATPKTTEPDRLLTRTTIPTKSVPE